MMPYLAPEAHMPITSCAPRLAAMKARLVIQTGTEPAGRQKIAAGGDFALHQPADAQDECEVERQDEVVDRG